MDVNLEAHRKVNMSPLFLFCNEPDETRHHTELCENCNFMLSVIDKSHKCGFWSWDVYLESYRLGFH